MISGCDVLALDNRPPAEPAKGLTFHQVDLCDLDSCRRHFEGVDVVIHTAGLHGLHLGQYDRFAFFSNNVLATFHVLTAARAAGVRRVVFTSSASIYGTSLDPVDGEARWVDEETPLAWRSHDVYDASKMVGEQLCEHYSTTYKIEVIDLRLSRFFFDDYVSYNVRKLYRGIDIRDAAEAHVVAALSRDIAGFTAFNISARSPFTRADLADLYRDAPSVVERYFPGVIDIFSANRWSLPKSIGRVYSIAKATRELGFRPVHNFERFLEEVRQSDVPLRERFRGIITSSASTVPAR